MQPRNVEARLIELHAKDWHGCQNVRLRHQVQNGRKPTSFFLWR